MSDLTGNADYSCQRELERKTLEAFESLDHSYRTGRISAAFYRGALRGIDLATRGLTPETFALAIDQESSFLPEKETRSAVYASSKMIYLLSMTVGEDFFVIRTVPAGEGKKVVKGEGTDPVASAAQKFTQFENKLVAAGYQKM